MKKCLTIYWQSHACQNVRLKQSHVICLATIGIGNAYELDRGIHLSLI